MSSSITSYSSRSKLCVVANTADVFVFFANWGAETSCSGKIRFSPHSTEYCMSPCSVAASGPFIVSVFSGLRLAPSLCRTGVISSVVSRETTSSKLFPSCLILASSSLKPDVGSVVTSRTVTDSCVARSCVRVMENTLSSSCTCSTAALSSDAL